MAKNNPENGMENKKVSETSSKIENESIEINLIKETEKDRELENENPLITLTPRRLIWKSKKDIDDLIEFMIAQ